MYSEIVFAPCANGCSVVTKRILTRASHPAARWSRPSSPSPPDLLRGEPLTIFGDGRQSRDFVYVDDVVAAWTAALANPAAYGRVFNIGSGERLSINDLADHVLAAFGRTRANGAVVYGSARPGEQRHVEADTTQSRSALGWTPRVPFEEGLAETVSWAETNARPGDLPA